MSRHFTLVILLCCSSASLHAQGTSGTITLDADEVEAFRDAAGRAARHRNGEYTPEERAAMAEAERNAGERPWLFKDGKPISARARIWGDRGSFPHEAVMLRIEINERRRILEEESRRVPNTLAEAEAIEMLEARLVPLLEAPLNQQVQAIVSVLRTTADEVQVLPDVSWGWPTQAPGSFQPETEWEHRSRRHKEVVLQERGEMAPPEQLRLAVGGEVPVEVATKLVWNDKLLVSFRVVTIEEPEPRRAADPFICVTIDDLQYEGFLNPSVMSERRTDIWPAPGTLPAQLQVFCSEAPSGLLTGVPVSAEAGSFCLYAKRSRLHGKAILPVTRVTATEVLLDFRSSWPGQRIGVCVVDERSSNPSIPTSSLEPQRARQLEIGEPLLVTFDVSDVTFDGRIGALDLPEACIRVENVTLASPKEQQLAARELAVANQAIANRQREEALLAAEQEVENARIMTKIKPHAEELGPKPDVVDEVNSQTLFTEEAPAPPKSFRSFLWLFSGGALFLLLGLWLYTQRHRFAGESEDGAQTPHPRRGDPYA